MTTATTSQKKIFGILGGMGPLASAEFLKTIYECSLSEREQDAPTVLLYSDPSVPDRTEALLSGRHELLLSGLAHSLERLLGAGADQVAICCVTMHCLVGQLPPHLAEKVFSLLDITFAALAESRERHLLVCTNGTRQLAIFQEHGAWPSVKERVVLPNGEDQNRIHQEVIYGIKRHHDIGRVIPVLESMLAKYQVSSMICGCTEMHLVAKHLMLSPNRHAIRCLDPLTLLATKIVKERL